MMPAFRFVLWLPALIAALALAGCGEQSGSQSGQPAGDAQADAQAEAGDGDGAAASLTLYAGRSRSLVEPIIENFEQQTGHDVQVRFGKDAQLLQTMQAEGDYSPADVYWANTAGALGAASNADLLAELPPALRDTPGAFVPSSGLWVPITARFRVLAYNADAVGEDALPDSVMDLTALSDFEGRIGWTPTYSSFQDFVTALRLTQGREAAKQWLTDMQALSPKSYTSNTPMIQALAAGEIDIALTNHYYVHRLKRGGGEGEYEGHEEHEEHEEGSHEEEEAHAASPDAPVQIHHFGAGDVGNLALVTGAGVLTQSEKPELAQQFIAHLLSAQSQRFAATSVHEYPVVEQVNLPDHLLPMPRVLELSPEFDFTRLRELDETLSLMREAGLL